MLWERGYFTEGFEFGDFAFFELIQKPRILTPEQPHIRYIKQLHRKPLQPKPTSPRHILLLPPPIPEYHGMQHPTPQHLQPLALIQYLQLEARKRKRKIRIYPPHLYPLPKQIPHQPLQRHLQILHHNAHLHIRLFRWEVMGLEYADSVHLVEDGVVVLVDLVAAVDVAEHYELFCGGGYYLGVVGGCVGA